MQIVRRCSAEGGNIANTQIKNRTLANKKIFAWTNGQINIALNIQDSSDFNTGRGKFFDNNVYMKIEFHLKQGGMGINFFMS